MFENFPHISDVVDSFRENPVGSTAIALVALSTAFAVLSGIRHIEFRNDSKTEPTDTLLTPPHPKRVRPDTRRVRGSYNSPNAGGDGARERFRKRSRR